MLMLKAQPVTAIDTLYTQKEKALGRALMGSPVWW
jgi:hypothetical protein